GHQPRRAVLRLPRLDGLPGRAAADRGVVPAMPVSTFLVTGGAGFIGSHLVERLLADGGEVRLLDNFSTGSEANPPFLERHRARVEIVKGDLRDLPTVERAARGAAVIFHQAAMRSVPRSVADPLGANENNVTGTLHVL